MYERNTFTRNLANIYTTTSVLFIDVPRITSDVPMERV